MIGVCFIGTGIIGILLCGKTNLKQIYGIDIQPQVCDMANRSIMLNNLEDKFKIIQEINKESIQLDEARGHVITLVQNVSNASQDIAAHMEETSAGVEEVSSMAVGLKDKAEELAEIVKDIEKMVSIFEIEE